ncbi:MAG TPA: hypothetical protein VGY76_11975 [Solirubrobacteraceae bacterium]|nr:hypothetical protein [Solirubrobacteraceae bacterium]
MSSATCSNDPTSRQLHFVRSLAEQTGTSFTPPKTRAQASREIERLLALKESGHVELAIRSSDVKAEPIQAEPVETELVYATGVQPGEVVGFGSAASWRKAAPEQAVPPAAALQVGQLTELKRYSVSGGERVLYGQRINGSVRITDRPASGGGRAYLVERELERDGYSALKALVADYIEQARDLDAIPMASSVVRCELQQAAA